MHPRILPLAVLAVLGASPASAQIGSRMPVRTAQPQQPLTTLTVAASPFTVASAAKQAGKNAIAAAQDIKAQFPNSDYPNIGSALLAVGYTPLETLIAIKSVYSASLDQQLLAIASGKVSLVDVVRAMHDANRDLAAQALVKMLVAAKRPADEIIVAIAQGYGLPPGTVGGLLRLAGMNHFDVAEALRIALKTASVDALADALRAAGFKEDGIALGLVSSLNATTTQIAAVFHRWNVPPDQAAKVLANTLHQSAKDALAALATADYQAAQLARAARDAFNAGSNQVASLLMEVLKNEIAVEAALMQGLGLDDAGTFDAMLRANVPAAKAMNALIQVAKIGGGRAAVLLKAHAIDAATAGTILKNQFNATGNQVAAFMKQASYTVNDVATVCKSVFQQSVNDAAATLVSAQFDPPGILNALMQVFQIGVAAATQILTSLGIKL